MTPFTIIQQARADGVTLALAPTGSIKARGHQEAVHRWLPLIREHKPAIIAALSGQPDGIRTGGTKTAPDERQQRNEGSASRRQRLLEMLARSPEARYAVLTADIGKGPVIVAIGKRSGEMVEVEIERHRFDGMTLLELVERHTVTMH